MSIEYVETFEALPEIARDIVRLRHIADLVIVCGGDGSVSSSALAAMESGLPLGIIPMGTANDLARTLANSAEAAATIIGVMGGGTACALALGVPAASEPLIFHRSLFHGLRAHR